METGLADVGVAASPGWLRRLVFSRRPFVDALFLLISFPVGLVAFVSLVVMIALGVGLAIIWIGLPILVLAMLGWRQGAGLERWRVGVFLDVAIPDPHRPWPAGSVWRRLRTMVADPAVWRDLAYWILLFPIGIAELVLVVSVVTVTVTLVAAPFSYSSMDINMGSVHVHTLPEALGLMVLGIVAAPVAALLISGAAWLHGRLARVLLGPNRAGRLAERVDVLAESRSRMVDASIDERRRIERDLHDGAQQRLVALAMDLGMARERMESDPDSARELVDEAHQEAKRALAELRDLVRGIHPAVLTDRGLDAAVSALAGRSQVPVTVSCDVSGRLPEAIESTAYFVVAEGLTNVAKHSRARHAFVSLRLSEGRLSVEIADDGVGGADPNGGSGLRGLGDRVAAVDGGLVLERTAAGRTVLRAEIPCAS
ncbi:MAG TPA: sensor histidine kinase [Solirubrobacteraceae bacterium]|nr:sensor histidine kinase [Solirubrobacteraceae bacterium]